MKKDLEFSKVDERVEVFLLHEHSLLESKLQNNANASDERIRFFITLISSGVAVMAFLPRVIFDGYNLTVFLALASGMLWLTSFYYNIIETKNFISRLEIYYKIFTVKKYFEKYAVLKDYLVNERVQSWLFEGYREENSQKQPAPVNAVFYVFFGSLFFAFVGYFLAELVLMFYPSFIISCVLFTVHLIYSYLKLYWGVTKSDANLRLMRLVNEQQIVVE